MWYLFMEYHQRQGAWNNPHSLQELKDNIQPEMFEDNNFFSRGPV
jgi:hypothetical protein